MAVEAIAISVSGRVIPLYPKSVVKKWQDVESQLEVSFLLAEYKAGCYAAEHRQDGQIFWQLEQVLVCVAFWGFGRTLDHRSVSNPITQMGLFMDGDGIPLALCINRGNMNEQLTLKPLEKKILSGFELSRFVVCTDAGLSSEENRKFNDKNGRAFITTQSIKKLKEHLKKWSLASTPVVSIGLNGCYCL